MQPVSAARNLLSAYDMVRVVSLANRIDRRHRLDLELARSNLFVEYFHGIVRLERGPFLKVGSHGAFLSHLALLKQAAAKHESVLILQDDCTFLPRRELQTDPSLFDIWYGGWDSLDDKPVEVSVLAGAHCMGFSARAASAAADYLERRYKNWCTGSKELPPIDGMLNEFRWHHRTMTACFEKVAIQRSSRSDMSPGRVDTLVLPALLLDGVRSVKTALNRRAIAPTVFTAAPVRSSEGLRLAA